MLPAIEC